MKNYQRVVVAVELLATSDRELIKRAKCLVHDFKADVILVHAVMHVGTYIEDNIAAEFEIQEALFQSATKRMRALGALMGVAENKQIIEAGSAKTIILAAAIAHKADLIMIGSHGRHGLQLLLGSTANAVLHGAKCDVLAIRLKE
jgi:universal stress protein A